MYNSTIIINVHIACLLLHISLLMAMSLSVMDLEALSDTPEPDIDDL